MQGRTQGGCWADAGADTGAEAGADRGGQMRGGHRGQWRALMRDRTAASAVLGPLRRGSGGAPRKRAVLPWSAAKGVDRGVDIWGRT